MHYDDTVIQYVHHFFVARKIFVLKMTEEGKRLDWIPGNKKEKSNNAVQYRERG